LPLPVLASARLLEKNQLTATSRQQHQQQQQQQQTSFVISSAEVSSDSASNNNNNNNTHPHSSTTTSSNSINNNNNSSLLRSALTSKAAAAAAMLVAATEGAVAPKQQQRAPQTPLKSGSLVKCERQVEDIFLLSLEGREAVARLKDGANQLFPNTRVTSEPLKELPNVISIEVDITGNLVLHKTATAATAADHHQQQQLAKVRKYHRRAREEPRKECRLLHYCHICNKGFKDKYSVNVHVRTHTGEKPFACQMCGKKFRQKAHLAKHHQTHSARPAAADSSSSMAPLAVSSQQPTFLQLGVEQQQQPLRLEEGDEDDDDEDDEEALGGGFVGGGGAGLSH
jgi:hypothetical protein